jgi:hypothetical protein
MKYKSEEFIIIIIIIIILFYFIFIGERSSIVAKARRYKPGGREFETQSCNSVLSIFPNPSDRPRPWDSVSL